MRLSQRLHGHRTGAYAHMLRLADGPDEVHRASIAKGKLKVQAEKAGMEIPKK